MWSTTLAGGLVFLLTYDCWERLQSLRFSDWGRRVKRSRRTQATHLLRSSPCRSAVSQPDPPPVPVADPLLPVNVPDPTSGPVVEPLNLPGIDPPPQASQGQGPQPTSDAVPSPPVITTSTDSDGGNLNVSVRVDSSGTDGSVSQEQVISPPAEPDITSSGNVGGTAAPDATAEPALTDSTPPGSTNTNVAVRVASPGDNGPVSQDNGSSLPAAQAVGQLGDQQDGADTPSSDPTSAAQGSARCDAVSRIEFPVSIGSNSG